MSTTSPSPSVRIVDGAELPAVGRWRIDPGHAEVGFVGRHLVFTKVRGRFRSVDGFVEVTNDPNDTLVDVTIEMGTVDSGDETRDEHLRSSDLFDVAQFPTATFRGRAHSWAGHGGKLAGDLTIKHVTRSVELDVTYLGSVTDPWSNERAIFSATGAVNREDWGIGWNIVLETGGLLVSKDIQLELELELIRDH